MGALAWLLAIAFALMSLRSCAGDGRDPAVAALPPGLATVAPDSPGLDFAGPPESRAIETADGALIHEGHVERALREGGQAGQWSAFTWEIDREVVATIAPGLDRRHHFANAYLVGHVPYADVEPWVPLAALARDKSYRYDHEQYAGRGELWQTSREAFYYPQGDCEDHAIALADWLIGLGHDARVVIGRVRGDGHAWVVLFDGDRTFLLEATDKQPGLALPLAEKFPEYQPEAMFNRESYWVNAGTVLTTDYDGPAWELRSTFRRR